jgi:hypothetical protein
VQFRDGPAAVIDVTGLNSAFPASDWHLPSALAEKLDGLPVSWQFTLLAIA